jgi:hypothetical protein
MIPTTATGYQDRVKAAQCSFACRFIPIRAKRCLMIPVDVSEELLLYESLKLLNKYDSRDFDLEEATWNVLTTTEIHELLKEVEDKLC